MTKKKLLILDDDETIRFNMKLYLEDEGFECADAGDSEAAFLITRKGGFALSIVDLRLPGINGEDYIKKSYVLNPEMKYLIHTGNTQYILPKELSKLGINREDVFYKPVESFDIIVKKIKQYI
jgi:DNA-binding NtrC family response regulator